MKLNMNDVVIINKAKKRLQYWHLVRLLILVSAIAFFALAIYLIIATYSYIHCIYLGSISGLLLRFSLNNWGGLKKDILLSRIETND